MKWAIALAGLMFTASSCNSQQKAKQTDGFAVVELFTSEGCSSCPIADAFMPTLLQQYKDGLYILSFHVDYWDGLGWKDVFASKQFTERQEQYVSTFNEETAYTPEVIINGKAGITGSDKSSIANYIDAELHKSTNMPIMLSAKKDNNNYIKINYRTTLQANEVLNIVLVQSHAATEVRRGENAGKTLQHINVVRSMKILQDEKGILMMQLPADLLIQDCNVIAYTQSTTDMHIHAAASVAVEL